MKKYEQEADTNDEEAKESKDNTVGMANTTSNANIQSSEDTEEVRV